LTPATENTEHTGTKYWIFSMISVASVASVVNEIWSDSNRPTARGAGLAKRRRFG
jgi:hypothetical protein